MDFAGNLTGMLLSREQRSGNLKSRPLNYFKSLSNQRNQSRSEKFQKLSTLFPALGSPYNVVILGFTPCGDYLVSLDNMSARFHLVSLSCDEIKVQEMHVRLPQNVNLSNEDGMPWWTSPFEILISPKAIKYIATLNFAQFHETYYDELCSEDIASLCELRLFSLGKLLTSISISAVLDQSFLFELPTIHAIEKTFLYLNSGNSVSFYLLGERSCSVEYQEIIEGVELPSELRSSKTFYHRSAADNDWFWCNMSENNMDNTWSPQGASETPSVPQAKFKVERFLRNVLLPFYYPGLDVLHSLKGYEIRFLGPGEKGPYVLMVIAALINPSFSNRRSKNDKSGEKEIAYLIALHPFLGDISILKIRDLGEFYHSSCVRSTGSQMPAAEVHSLSFFKKVDFYCKQLRLSDPFLRDFMSTFHSLSSLDACKGSIRRISHPFLPLVIYNDERY